MNCAMKKLLPIGFAYNGNLAGDKFALH